MYIVKAEANQVEKIVEMSVRAFETDVNVGGAKGEYPPEFDSVEWHKQMAREGHLYQAMIEQDLVGAAIIFPDETKKGYTSAEYLLTASIIEKVTESV